MGDALPALVGPLSILSDADLAVLVASGRWCSFEPGETLVRQGARDRSLHVLVDGQVKVQVTAMDGRAVLLEFCGPGETIGELSAFDGRPRSADAIACGPVRTLRVEAEVFTGFLRSRPEIALGLLRMVSARLRDANTTRLELSLEPTLQRVARRVLELAALHGEASPEGLRVPMPVTQQELADWVGASREGVSEALRHLRETGTIDTGRRTILVRDVAALRLVAS